MIIETRYKAVSKGYTSTEVKVTRDNKIELWARDDEENRRTLVRLENCALEPMVEQLIEAMDLIGVRERSGYVPAGRQHA